MITRRAPLKRSPLNRKRTRKRKGEDSDYRAWLHTWPCILCIPRVLLLAGMISARARRAAQRVWCRGCSEVAHVGVRGLGQKCPDREAIPLCRYHHQHPTVPGGSKVSYHSLGKHFWSYWDIDRDELLTKLQQMYDAEQQP